MRLGFDLTLEQAQINNDSRVKTSYSDTSVY